MRVLVVERSPFLRLLLRELLTRANDAVVGECGGLGEAAAMAVDLHPDVILLDMESGDGKCCDKLDVLRRVAPSVRVVALGPADLPAGEPSRALVETYLSKPW
ncbi:MAG: hypothetical protein ACM3XS_05790, partial [Bacteroidota bacterium]